MTTATKHNTITKAKQQAAVRKKAAPARQERPMPKQPVYFFAAGCGSFVLESPDTALLPLGDGTHEKVKVPGVEIPFGPDGVSPPLDPDREDDAALIEAARKHLRDVAEGIVLDERVSKYKFREMAPQAPKPPFDKWDTTDWAKLPDIVKTLGYDPVVCINYERSRGAEARYELVDALEELAAAPDDDDPFAGVEVDV